ALVGPNAEVEQDPRGGRAGAWVVDCHGQALALPRKPGPVSLSCLRGPAALNRCRVRAYRDAWVLGEQSAATLAVTAPRTLSSRRGDAPITSKQLAPLRRARCSTRHGCETHETSPSSKQRVETLTWRRTRLRFGTRCRSRRLCQPKLDWVTIIG